MKRKTIWLDVYLSHYKWYRKLAGGDWYEHRFTKDAGELTFDEGKIFWARYPKINRYSDVVQNEKNS